MVLESVRILDLTMGWAGPLATMILADFGAEVIKIEALQRPDWWRGSAAVTGQQVEAEKPWERAPTFNSTNRNKYGITLNLAHPKAVELFKRLVRVADIVVENYAPRVMAQWGLTYPVLQEINPKLIMMSMPSFGLSGPWRDYIGYGTTVECVGALPSITGYEDGPPRMMSNAYGDPVSGLNGAAALLMALLQRRRTGKGTFIELSQLECLVPHLGGALMDYIMNGRIWQRRGNRDFAMAPHGCYRTLGDDRWVVIAVASDDEWRRLCNAMEQPELAADERFADALSRHRNQTLLDPIIAEWSRTRSAEEVTELLQRQGIAAGPVLTSADLLADPHLAARGFFVEWERPYVGRHRYPGMVARLSRTPGEVRKATPCLGEDNDYVFRRLLSLTDAEIASLETEEIIGQL